MSVWVARSERVPDTISREEILRTAVTKPEGRIQVKIGQHQWHHRIALAFAAGLLASLLTPRAKAQSQPPQYVTTVWQTEQGLPQNSVNALAQDHDGYLWVGTFGGLARFDGERFRVLGSADLPGLGSVRIISLYESRSGVLWVGTAGGGLTRLHDGVATTYTERDGLPSGFISSIRGDAEGNVWINTSGGLARFAGAKLEAYPTHRGKAVREFYLQARDGSMWFRSGEEVLRFGADGSIATLNVPKPSVFLVHEARDGSVWIAVRDAYRLVRYYQGVFSDVPLPPIGRRELTAGYRVYAVTMAEDSDRELLLLTPAGLVRTVGGRLSPPEALPLPANGAELPKVRSLLVDREGNLWVGMMGTGLVRLRPAPLTAYGKAEGLSDSSFYAVFQDREGRVWLGGDLLYWFDGHQFHLFPGVRNIRAVAQTRDGDLWFGGYGGLYRCRSGVLTHFQVEAPLVNVIHEDREGTLWIGGVKEDRPGGLYRFREGKFDQIPGISDAFQIIDDRDSGLLVAGVEGLFYVRGDKAIPHHPNQSLPGHLGNIYQDSTGTFWLPTHDAGLFRLRDGRLKAITTKDGLPNNMLLCILEDGKGNLWASSNHNIFRLSLKELNDFADGRISSVLPVSYGIAEGMRTSECNGGSPGGWKTTDGRIWFPTLRGVVAIDPGAGSRLPPPVVLEEAWANQLTLARGGQTSVPPGNNTLDFRFTALSLSAPERTRFKYRLEPFDKDWVDAGTRRTAHYTNMAPGKYSFQVVAANSYGIWSDQGASARFVLRPHFYQTLWFRLVLLAGIVLLAVSFHRLAVRHLRARATQLKQLADTLQEQADLLNLTHDTIFVADMQGVIKYWNRGAEEQYGWTAEQAVGRDVHDLLKTVFPAPLEQIKAEVTRAGRWEGELVQTKKDGTQLVVASRWSLQRGEQGAPLAILETNNDITERKRAEEALCRSNRELRAISNCNQTLLRATDEQSLLDEICRIVCEEAGYRMAWVAYAEHDEAKSVRPVAWIGIEERYLANLGITWADTERGSGPTGTAIRSGKTCCIQDFAADPRLTPWRESALPRGFRSAIALPLKDEHASAFGSLSIYSAQPNAFTSEEIRLLEELAADLAFGVVTLRSRAAREQAEQGLRQSEAYLAESQRLTHTGSWALDLASDKYVYVSEEDFRLWGFDPQEGLPSREAVFRRIHPEDRDKMRASFEKSLREKVDSSDEYRIVLPDGTVKHVHTIRHPVLNGAGDVVKLVGTSVDITERKQAEEALREGETRFRTFVDHAADALFIYDFEQRTIVDVNQQACESLGYTRQELIGTTALAFHLDSDRAQMESVAQRAAAGETAFDTHWHRRKDGTLFPVEVHTSQYWYGGRRFLLKVARDASDRLRAEEQRERLRQTEADLAHINRVSMMGELTASIAHEVNQPLSGVVTNGSACLRWLAGDVPNVEEAREAARRIVRDGKRAGEVISRVRALTKRSATPREKLDMNETIRDVLALVGDEAKRKGVMIRTQFADDLSPVSGDRVQLQQVVLNLVMNATEAMSSVDDRPRELFITTRNIDADQVLATVKDSGTGIDPNTLDKIFDPFYTTKPGGMGMGLSISRTILQAHGGRLWATVNDGPGTSFHFTLPNYHEE
jgi:PAS domain S-box-containing protein